VILAKTPAPRVKDAARTASVATIASAAIIPTLMAVIAVDVVMRRRIKHRAHAKAIFLMR